MSERDAVERMACACYYRDDKWHIKYWDGGEVTQDEIPIPPVKVYSAMEYIKTIRAEKAQLQAEVDQLKKQKANILESHKTNEYELRQYRELIAAVNAKRNDGEYWAWMPNEDNHLETLSCPVMIPAEWLRNLIDEAKKDAEAELTRLREQISEEKWERWMSGR